LTTTGKEVDSAFDLTYNPYFATNVPANSFIIIHMPFFANGFVRANQMITCYIIAATSTSVPCIAFQNSDYILFRTSAILNSGAATNFLIKNLVWPRYVDSTKNCVETFVSSSTSAYSHYSGSCVTFTLPASLPSPFTLTKLDAPKKGLGMVDCTYTFTFVSKSLIPLQSTIVLTFPSDYNLLISNPALRFSAPTFSSATVGGTINTVATSSQLFVSNMAVFPANSPFTIIVEGLRNPTSGTQSSGWRIEIKYNDMLISQQASFTYFPYGTAYIPGIIIFNSIFAYPLNADEFADYSIEFTPSYIPAYGEIWITFPDQRYKSMPSPLVCIVSGGMQSFDSCTLSSTTIKIVLDTKYQMEKGSIFVKILSIQNPSQV